MRKHKTSAKKTTGKNFPARLKKTAHTELKFASFSHMIRLRDQKKKKALKKAENEPQGIATNLWAKISKNGQKTTKRLFFIFIFFQF
jgi:hypothetical protein